MFFHYSQNNSGGKFVFDLIKGITHHVVIEAKDIEEANSRAKGIGLYWDGCSLGIDCPCCGDRWNKQYDENDGCSNPMVYNELVSEVKLGFMKHVDNGKEAVVHFLNGEIKWYGE